MQLAPRTVTKGASKVATGIAGFDEMTGGGLPQGRTTLVTGGPGSGKTILALQFLAHGAHHCRQPGIFVAFEETPKRIVGNAAGFGWKLAELQSKNLYFMDAQPSLDQVHSGDFDLSGMLAALECKIKDTKARRIVFDAIDIVLALLPNAASQRREIYRLHAWLLAHNLTSLITLKSGTPEDGVPASQQQLGFMQFMVDCSVILGHSVEFGVSQRSLRVQKYRGTSFDENASPFIIGNAGFDVAGSRTPAKSHATVTDERISSGVKRLDTMLGGGYYRGSSILITGFPGTAKTTLSGAFAEAACLRGERTLFISFDSDSNELVRNLASVGIRLGRHVKTRRLRISSARRMSGSAETYLVRIKAIAKEHRARCIVIDPASALGKSGNELTAHSVTERLLDWAKATGRTLVCTSLLDESSAQPGAGSMQHISTLADTWIHLNYLVQAGERNRGLSIIKSRGTSHSNQVRELILSHAGVTLTDAYTAGGEVLMGTMRWEKESEQRHTQLITETAGQYKRVMLEAQASELEVRVRSLQVELAAKQAEKALLARSTENRKGELSQGRARLRVLRCADAKIGARK
jgi:circadian clock protein KaiC